MDYWDATTGCRSLMIDYGYGIQFWNPGDVFGDDSRLWEPGEKEVRNPSVAMALRRIAMCEQAGTGLRMIREEWKKLGHPVPICKNDRSMKAFEFFLPVEMSELKGLAQPPYKSAYKSNPPRSNSPIAGRSGKWRTDLGIASRGIGFETPSHVSGKLPSSDS